MQLPIAQKLLSMGAMDTDEKGLHDASQLAKKNGLWGVYELVQLSKMGDKMKGRVKGERDRIERLKWPTYS